MHAIRLHVSQYFSGCWEISHLDENVAYSLHCLDLTSLILKTLPSKIVPTVPLRSDFV